MAFNQGEKKAMKSACLVNYNFSPQDWWLKYGYEAENVTMYDRSDDGEERTFAAKTIKTENIGNVDYDKLSYLIDNYESLPKFFLWGKSNMFKYISEEEFGSFDRTHGFVPLLTRHHRTYNDPDGTIVCFYDGGMYHERSGIVNTLPRLLPAKYFFSWESWCINFNIPNVGFIPFPPGGNFILTRECVHRFSKSYYESMRATLTHAQTPFEAQLCERSYFLLWQ